MTRWGEIKCPRCEDAFQMYVDANEARIDAEEKLRKSALQELSALGQASEAYQAQLAAEAKLAKAVEAGVDVAASLSAAISLLERGGKKAAASDRMFAQMLLDYNASLDRFRTTLAELKGQDDE